MISCGHVVGSLAASEFSSNSKARAPPVESRCPFLQPTLCALGWADRALSRQMLTPRLLSFVSASPSLGPSFLLLSEAFLKGLFILSSKLFPFELLPLPQTFPPKFLSPPCLAPRVLLNPQRNLTSSVHLCSIKCSTIHTRLRFLCSSCSFSRIS